MNPRSEIPDVPLPIVGWRAWVAQGSQMRSFTQGGSPIWNQGFLQAFCHKGHQAPQEGCQCGIYILKRRRWWLWLYGSLVGQARVWGKVIEHTNGYRAQFAQLVKIEQRSSAKHFTAVVPMTIMVLAVLVPILMFVALGVGGILVLAIHLLTNG